MYLFSPFVVALVAVFSSGSSNINFVNAQTLAGKWALQNPITTFVAETKTFTLIFDIDRSIAQGNTVSAVYDKDCLEGNSELLVADGVEEKATVVGTSGRASLSFNLNTDILRMNSKVFSPDTPSPGFAEMKVCARFMLQTDDASYEVNFIETVLTIVFDLQAGFVIDFSADNKVVLETINEKNYIAEAYLCDPRYPEIRLPSYALTQGGTITTCVIPNEEAMKDGLCLRSVDDFIWVRGRVTQPAIESGVSASNQLTMYECAPGSQCCSFVSILYGDFFERPTPPPTIAPSKIPSTSPSSYPTNNPTSAPISRPPTNPDWPVQGPPSSYTDGPVESPTGSSGEAIVIGSGTATLQFGGSHRLEGGRALQVDDTVASAIGMSFTVSTEDEGPYRLRTAGGASLSATNFISILGLIVVNALLLLLS